MGRDNRRTSSLKISGAFLCQYTQKIRCFPVRLDTVKSPSCFYIKIDKTYEDSDY